MITVSDVVSGPWWFVVVFLAWLALAVPAVLALGAVVEAREHAARHAARNRRDA